MRRDKYISWIRIYIIVICIVRTLVLLIAGANGFNIYFPRSHADHNLVFSSVVLIIFWLIAIFFESINPVFIWFAFLLDGLMSYFCGMGIYRQYGSINIYEAICFGNIVFIMLDILFIVYLVNMENKKRRRRRFLK